MTASTYWTQRSWGLKSSRRSWPPLHYPLHSLTTPIMASRYPNTEEAPPPRWHASHLSDSHQSTLGLHFLWCHLSFGNCWYLLYFALHCHVCYSYHDHNHTFWDKFRVEGGYLKKKRCSLSSSCAWVALVRWSPSTPNEQQWFSATVSRWQQISYQSCMRRCASWAVSSAKNGLMDTERFPHMKRGLSADCSGKMGKGLYVGGCSSWLLFFFSHHHTFISVPLVSIAAFVCSSVEFFFFSSPDSFDSVVNQFCLYSNAFF